MAVPNLLLLTATPPGYPGGGGPFLRDLCLSYPRDKICCYSITPGNGWSLPQDLNWLPIEQSLSPRQDGLWQLGRHFALFGRFISQQYVRLVQVPALIERVAAFARRHDVEIVWAVLNAPTLIYMAKRVASALGARLVTTIWDPPQYLAATFGLDRFSRQILLRDFERALHTSARCGVASEGMGEEYGRQYGVQPAVLITGVHPGLRRPPAKKLTNEKELIIGFAGSWYALREWEALLSALSQVAWCVEGRDVTIRILARKLPLQASGKARFEYLGWRSTQDTLELMSEVDIAYLPYWFDESHSLSVRLCFPNKLTTYLAAGRPVLFHGPEDSSPARFFRRFPVGLCCHSLEEGKIIKTLRQFVIDTEFYALATQAGQSALDQELDLRVFRRRFATLIGIEEHELLPLTKHEPST